MVTIFNEIGEQLKKPRGIFGRIIGWLMLAINRTPNNLVIEQLELSPSDNVLEIGCGPGYALKSICGQLSDGVLVGIDHSNEMLTAAYSANQINIESGKLFLIEANFRDIPIKSGSIDRVVAINVAYFFSEDGKEMREIFRVLSNNGLVVIYATSEETMKLWPFASKHTHRHLNEGVVRNLVIEGGFESNNICIVKTQLSFGVKGMIVVAIKSLEDA